MLHWPQIALSRYSAYRKELHFIMCTYRTAGVTNAKIISHLSNLIHIAGTVALRAAWVATLDTRVSVEVGLFQ